jgi:hypothetical protein
MVVRDDGGKVQRSGGIPERRRSEPAPLFNGQPASAKDELDVAHGSFSTKRCNKRHVGFAPDNRHPETLLEFLLSANRDILSNCREYVVGRQRTPYPLQLELTDWFDRHGVLDRYQDTRTNEDLSPLRSSVRGNSAAQMGHFTHVGATWSPSSICT